MDKELRDAITETILRYAVMKNHKNEMAAMPSNEELSNMYRLSQHHEIRMKKLFSKERRKEIFLKASIAYKKIATAILIIVTTFFGALLTNEQVRAAVGQTVIEWYDQFTRFSFDGTSNFNDFEEWYPLYLPDGFRESAKNIHGGVVYIELINETGEIIQLEYAQNNMLNVNIDNEHSQYELFVYNDTEFHIFRTLSSEFTSKIIWQQSGYAFFIQSIIDADALLEIATSVNKI